MIEVLDLGPFGFFNSHVIESFETHTRILEGTTTFSKEVARLNS